MTNSTSNRTKTFCIRIVDFRASRAQIFRGFALAPLGGLQRPANPQLLPPRFARSFRLTALGYISRQIIPLLTRQMLSPPVVCPGHVPDWRPCWRFMPGGIFRPSPTLVFFVGSRLFDCFFSEMFVLVFLCCTPNFFVFFLYSIDI